MKKYAFLWYLKILGAAAAVNCFIELLGRKSAVFMWKYMVENPAVFSVLIREYPQRTVICGNGQLRLAVLILMDKFSCDTVFWYAGDFDPEGLLIAQKLKIRYGERLKLWKYEADLYETYLSEVELSDRRMKKLEQVSVQELQEIREAMYKKRRSAYQESMMEALRK